MAEKSATGHVASRTTDAEPDPRAALTEAHDALRRKRIELKRCLALLALSIARANVWYARREAELAAFDRLATITVDRLRIEHRIEASMAWNRPGATA